MVSCAFFVRRSQRGPEISIPILIGWDIRGAMARVDPLGRCRAGDPAFVLWHVAERPAVLIAEVLIGG
jgi:hypothetical protein